MISTGDKTTFGLLVPCKVYGNFDVVNVASQRGIWYYKVTSHNLRGTSCGNIY